METEAPVVWGHIANPNPKVWLVCTSSEKNGKQTPVVLPYTQVEQEEYVRTPDQNEALVNVFTTPGGADRFAAALAEDSDQDFIVRRMAWDEFLKLVRSTSEAYQLIRHHAIRFDVYDVAPGGLTRRREILYSRWVPKH